MTPVRLRLWSKQEHFSGDRCFLVSLPVGVPEFRRLGGRRVVAGGDGDGALGTQSKQGSDLKTSVPRLSLVLYCSLG